MATKSGTGTIRRVSNLRMAGIAALLGVPACGNGVSYAAAPDAGSVRTAHREDGSVGGGSSEVVGAFGAGGASGHAGSFGTGGSHGSLWGSSSDTADAGSDDMAFVEPFTALVSQDVPWAEMSVRIVGARIEKDSDPRSLSASQLYAELDLAVTNHGHDEVDYNDRDTWDLILTDGTRVRSENALGVLISPTDTARTTLRYPVSAGTTFTGSFLELNGSDRGKLEPERVPLDSAWQRKYPIEVDALRGGHIRQPEPFDSWLDLRILDARVDLNDPEGRAPVGTKFVHLDMKASIEGSSQNVLDSFFRIIVDGSSFAPVNDVNLLPAGNTTTNFEVLFTIPSDTTKFEIQIMPGGDMSMRFAADLTKNAHMTSSAGDAGAPDAGQ